MTLGETWAKTPKASGSVPRSLGDFLGNSWVKSFVAPTGSLPSEDTAVVLLFSLVASGQIRLRRIDGWQKFATVLRQQTPRAADEAASWQLNRPEFPGDSVT